MKRLLIILLFVPILVFGQDTLLENQKESWDKISGGFSVVGLSYTLATAALIMHLNDPFSIRDLRDIMLISSGVFIIGVLWVAKGLTRLFKAKKRTPN